MCPRAARSCALAASANGKRLSSTVRRLPSSSRRARDVSWSPFDRTWVVETVMFRSGAALEAEREGEEQGSAWFDDRNERLRCGAADHIHDDIDVVRHIGDPGRLVVDDHVGPEVSQERRLAGRGDRHHLRPLQPGELDREMSDAAGGSVDEDRPARERPRLVLVGLQGIGLVVAQLDQELPGGQ